MTADTATELHEQWSDYRSRFIAFHEATTLIREAIAVTPGTFFFPIMWLKTSNSSSDGDHYRHRKHKWRKADRMDRRET